MKPVIELRIHGVGGSTVKEMLGRAPEPKPLTSDADQTSGFWAWSEPKDGVERRAYLWGRYPPVKLGLWLALLPFTLVNAAGWAVGSGARSAGGRFASRRHRWSAIVSRWAVALLGVSLTAGWTLWIVRIVGDRLALQVQMSGWLRIGWALLGIGLLVSGVLLRVGAGSNRRRPRSGMGIWLVTAAVAGLLGVSGLSGDNRGLARGIALAASALATAIPFVLAGANRKRFEQYRARLGGTGEARERRRLGDEETLGAPCFYDHPTDSAGLLFVHGAIAVALLAVVTARAAILPSAVGTSKSTLLDVGPITTPFLGHSLLYIGFVQAFLVLLLMAAGLLGASRSSYGRRASGVNFVVNAFRSASLAGIGVFLFTAVVGVADTVTARAFGERIQLRNHPELELTPAFIGGALLVGVLVAAIAVTVRARCGSPPEDVPPELHGKWRSWQTVRWIVANTDRLIVLTGVVLAGCLATSAVFHRRTDLWTLVPKGEFPGVELQIIRHIKWLGLVEFVVPIAISVLAMRRDRFRSAVSAVWDVLSFWPRRFHPLGVPPESERTVPEVQSHLLHTLEDPEARVEIVAHSQGSVIAFAVLAGLRDRGALAQVSLVTLGSPLFSLYPRMFPAQVSAELIDELNRALEGKRWLNLHRQIDYFGVPPDDVVGIPNVEMPRLREGGVLGVGPPEYFARTTARKLEGRRYRTNVDYCGVEADAVGRITGSRRLDSDRPLYELCVAWSAMADGRPLDPAPRVRTDRFSRRDLFSLLLDEANLPQRAMVPLDGPDGAPGPSAPRLAVHHGYLGSPAAEAQIARMGEELRRTSPQRLPAVPSFAPRRRMVSWFDPRLLALTAYEAGVSAVFGKWADARHVQAIDAKAAAQGTIDLAPSEPEIWVDYVADPGDAFSPTFAVASALAQPVVFVGSETLHRGDILVMGGDEVYPAASIDRYENQLVGPYTLASRCIRDDLGGGGALERPLLLAIPGNHDWYDGLGSFDQVFCAQKSIGMWRTRQERSYWVVRLTGDTHARTWWLWGVDLQLGNRFDRRQLEYFRRQAEQLQEGDFVILCSPIPTWAHAQAEPTAFDALSNFVDQELRPRGARVVLHLSGDSHHFARYERQQLEATESNRNVGAPRTDGMCRVQYVTAGGGGAFTHPTHHLAQDIDLPVPYDDGATTLRLQREGASGGPAPHPDAAGSRRIILKNLLVVPFLRQNPGFLALEGTVAALAVFAAFRGPQLGPMLEAAERGNLARTVTSSALSLGLVVLVVAGWMAFARPSKGGSGLVSRSIGLVHGVAQVLALAAVMWASPQVVTGLHTWAGQSVREILHATVILPWVVGVFDWVALVVVAAILGGVAGSVVVAFYLAVANLLAKMHDNEAASAIADPNYKHFVRLRIKDDTATVWVLHVPDAERVAEQFAAHDPRPKPLYTDGSSPVEVWDRFEVGRATTSASPAPDPAGR